MTQPKLLLASTSPYRRRCLDNLGIRFDIAAPNVDETARPDEKASDLVLRLAREKSRALADRFPDHLIIGSDQLAVAADGKVMAKPGSLANAFEQLSHCSGSRVSFLTGISLHLASSQWEYATVEQFDVCFRNLAPDHIRRYLETERPFDCAGSFKMEGLGIALFERLEGRDPNALIGLPLIALEDGLQARGLSLMDYASTEGAP